MINDKTFDSLEWEEAAIDHFARLHIEEAEPVYAGYYTEDGKPVYCGVILYGTSSDGQRIALEISQDDEHLDTGLLFARALIGGGNTA